MVIVVFLLLAGVARGQGPSEWALLADSNEVTDYSEYQVVRLEPSSPTALAFLRSLHQRSSPSLLDFWQPPTTLNGTVDVAVAPKVQQRFFNELYYRRIHYNTLIDNLQQAIDAERVLLHPGVQLDGNIIQLDRYNRYDQIEAFLFDIQQKNPELVRLIEIGNTFENRTLRVVHIGKPSSALSKPKIWIDAGIHAREWISPAVALFLISKLVNEYDKDPEITVLLEQLDWYILPVMNPDGYVHTFDKNRMWRKNRRPSQCYKTAMSTMCCVGVDLNRNFNWFWATTGSSQDPCHDTYHGTGPFSEAESTAVKQILEKIKVDAFLTFHSYSQLWLIPYGHRKRTYPDDYGSVLKPLALQAIAALNRLYGTKYVAGTGADLMYEASGASHDYAKGQLQIKYAYLVELRPQNTMFANGFLLPEREIQPTCEETWKAIQVVADQLISESARAENATATPIQPTTAEPVVSISSRPKITFATEGPSVVTREPPSGDKVSPQRIIQCVDHGRYCKWWRIHNLCSKDRVRNMCPLSCLPECKI